MVGQTPVSKNKTRIFTMIITKTSVSSILRVLCVCVGVAISFLIGNSSRIWADPPCYVEAPCNEFVGACRECTQHDGPAGCLFEQLPGATGASYVKEGEGENSFESVEPGQHLRHCYYVRSCRKAASNNNCTDPLEPYQCESDPNAALSPQYTADSYTLTDSC